MYARVYMHACVCDRKFNSTYAHARIGMCGML